MSARRAGLQPVIRVAPPGELKAYVVYEHQLDALAQLMLNFALFFLGVAATALGTLYTAPPQDDRTYYTFLIVFLITLIAGVILLVIWYATNQSARALIQEIKSQMPPNPPIREDSSTSVQPPDTPTPPAQSSALEGSA